MFIPDSKIYKSNPDVEFLAAAEVAVSQRRPLLLWGGRLFQVFYDCTSSSVRALSIDIQEIECDASDVLLELAERITALEQRLTTDDLK